MDHVKSPILEAAVKSYCRRSQEPYGKPSDDSDKGSRAQAMLSWQGQLVTWTGDVVGVWKEHFEDLLNPANTSSWQEAKSKDLGDFISLAKAEVTEVVKKV